MIESAAHNGSTTPLPHRTSFIVRCWAGSREQLRVYLVDVRTGRTYLLPDLAELPARIHALLEPLPPPNEH